MPFKDLKRLLKLIPDFLLDVKWIMQIWQYHLPPNKEANWLFQHKHKLVDHKANWIRVHIRVLIAVS